VTPLSEGVTALIVAAQNGNPEVVQALIDAKADVNAKARNGDTPLSKASEKGHQQVVELLKKAGAQ
jgi:uncharacterized protein